MQLALKMQFRLLGVVGVADQQSTFYKRLLRPGTLNPWSLALLQQELGHWQVGKEVGKQLPQVGPAVGRGGGGTS